VTVAEVYLLLDEAGEGKVPPVCVCCGAPAAVTKNHTAFVGLGGLPFIVIPLLIVFVFQRATSIRLCLPFCSWHRNYWLWRRVINFGSFALMIVLVLGTYFLDLASQAGSASRQGDSWAGALCMLGLALPVVWLIAYLIHCRVGVRVANYTTESVTLEGVCEEFAAAVPVFRRPTVDSWDGPEFRDWSPGRNRSW
jgi:hypothetical protein